MRILYSLIISLLPFLPHKAQALDDSPLQLLSSAEKAYYTMVFDYVMDAVKADGQYQWESYGGKGMFTVSDVYVSKSGATCRNFTETFTVQGVGGENEGVGCKRVGYKGWCKLKLKDALTCSMEPKGTVVEDKLRDATEYLTGKEGKTNGIRQMLP